MITMSLLDPNKALYRAIEQMLKPLFRLLVRKGIGYPTFIELIKKLYVDAAWHEEVKKGGRITDSRLSTLTGIHRREVKRLREELNQSLLPSERKAGLAAQLVSQWLGRPEYVEADGTPKPLPYLSEQKETPDFQTLVQTITRDVHPRTLLDTWIKQGFLQMENDRVVLTKQGYVPDQSWEETLFFAGKNLNAHGATVVDNLLQEKSPQLDRAVYYYQLTPESAATLEQWAREKSLALLTEFNRKAAALQQADQTRPNANKGIHFGAYFHTEEQTYTS